MKIRVIGCHGSVAPEYQTSCYFIDDLFFIDAGSLCSVFTPEEQARIEHVFVTHPHLDHVKDLCFLIENSFSESRPTLNLYSSPEILEDLKKHLFNNVLWPDFAKIPVDSTTKRALLKYQPLSEAPFSLGHIRIQKFPVNHPGHAVGYLLDHGDYQVLFTGDTGPCSDIWTLANQCKNLKAIFTEITFPNAREDLARASGHMTLKLLMEDLSLLKNKNIPVYISHFKPLFLRELLEEFQASAAPHIHLMHEDDIISVD